MYVLLLETFLELKKFSSSEQWEQKLGATEFVSDFASPDRVPNPHLEDHKHSVRSKGNIHVDLL